ncbi:MAG: isoprenyl transferase [Gemmatimonadota bacterium]
MSDAGREAADLLDEALADGEVPAHVAVIMDGNGRWAKERGLPRWEGHRHGMEAVREVVEGALQAGIDYLTLYAFSRENWARPDEEVSALMDLMQEFVAREKEELRENGVRVEVFGELDDLPETGRSAVEEIQRHTREGDRLQLNLAISYGARTEIVQAVRKLARLSVLEAIRPDEITEERFGRELYTGSWPDPDLLIRTSGEMRLSNFLLWQIAYAELYVTDVLWPDFGRREFLAALREYQARERRFGRVES